MLKSCSRCGGVHDHQFICGGGIQRDYKKKDTLANKFRNTQVWREKRRSIVNRDRALCQLCINGLYALPHTRILNQKVQVHHITPINEDYSLRLDGNNLICLCTYHHHMAEHGGVTRKELKELARVQEKKVY